MNTKNKYHDDIKEIKEGFTGKKSSRSQVKTKSNSEQTQVIIEHISKLYFQEIHESQLISKKNKTTEQLKQKYSTY